MENIISIGAKVDKESVDNLAGGIATIFDSAFKNHISEDNIENALAVLTRTLSTSGVSITNSNFVGEDHTVSITKDGKTEAVSISA